MTAGATLRERQAEQVRSSILDAVIDQLEKRDLDEIAMADVATASGISLRTLYRYFPDRPALLHAAGERLYAELGVPFEISGPEDISASFLTAARRLSTRPALTRAMVQTSAGRAARSSVRRQRAEAIRTALKPLTDGLDARTARHASAVIVHLCSAASWVAMSDDSGIDADEAQQAVAWAIDALLESLRRSKNDRPARRSPRSS